VVSFKFSYRLHLGTHVFGIHIILYFVV
jgi:hypothetical protein